MRTEAGGVATTVPARWCVCAVVLAAAAGLLLAASIGGAAAGPAKARAYTITDLGTLHGGWSGATAINSVGQVVGQSDMEAFLWSPASAAEAQPAMVGLGTLGNSESSASGVNDRGEVIGNAGFIAFRWSAEERNGPPENPRMLPLGTLGGTQSAALGTNDAGQIVGWSATGDGNTIHAFLWTPGAAGGIPDNPQMRDLDAARRHENFSMAQAINDAGTCAVGFSEGQGGHTAVEWLTFRGRRRRLGTLGGPGGLALAESPDGRRIVGWARTDSSLFGHAFMWDGEMHALPQLDGRGSVAEGMNALGQIVGKADVPYWPQTDAVLWERGRITDLNRSLPAGSRFLVLTDAATINDRGQIAGTGLAETGFHAFLLTPTAAAAAAQ